MDWCGRNKIHQLRLLQCNGPAGKQSGSGLAAVVLSGLKGAVADLIPGEGGRIQGSESDPD